MTEKAQIILEGKTHEFPVVAGTENEKAVDVSKLRGVSSYITLDSGFANTGACLSSITFVDGEKVLSAIIPNGLSAGTVGLETWSVSSEDYPHRLLSLEVRAI